MSNKRQLNLRKLALMTLIFFALSSAANVSAQNKEALADKVSSYSDPVVGKFLNEFVTLNLSAQCWETMLGEDASPTGTRAARELGGSVVGYAKLMGYGNASDFVSGTQIQWTKVNPIIEKLKNNFSFTINAADASCADDRWHLLSNYAMTISDFYGDTSAPSGMNRGWRPAAGKMLITLNFSKTAKDVSVAVSPDKSQFTITAPSEVEVENWNGKIQKGMEKGGAQTGK